MWPLFIVGRIFVNQLSLLSAEKNPLKSWNTSNRGAMIKFIYFGGYYEL